MSLFNHHRPGGPSAANSRFETRRHVTGMRRFFGFSTTFSTFYPQKNNNLIKFLIARGLIYSECVFAQQTVFGPRGARGSEGLRADRFLARTPSGAMGKRIGRPSGRLVRREGTPSGGTDRRIGAPSGAMVRRIGKSSGELIRKIEKPSGGTVLGGVRSAFRSTCRDPASTHLMPPFPLPVCARQHPHDESSQAQFASPDGCAFARGAGAGAAHSQ